jgi:hypothetical protein
VIRRILHRLMGWTYDSEHISVLNFTGRSDSGPLKRLAIRHAIGGLDSNIWKTSISTR